MEPMNSLAFAEKKIDLILGDITEQNIDIIANAANSQLRGGGRVDGAIHRAGGPTIMAACRAIGTCPTGNAVITTAGLLSANFVIHTVGPIYSDGKQGEAKELTSAYRSSLELAALNKQESIAFPSISTGIYGYPVPAAAAIAIAAVANFLQQRSSIELVRFVLFDQQTFDAYQKALSDFRG
jgi:O-acetyl-ADP-ribose deacetylase (regulator of RNase III)